MNERDVQFCDEVAERGGAWEHVAPLAEVEAARERIARDFAARVVAALYVDPRGPYPKMQGVDAWDEARDARKYAGPHPVVAHPPCQRWGRYWFGGPTAHLRGARRTLGDDGGCFAAALDVVRQWGGVLEHPADSHAWQHFGLCKPPRNGGWVVADNEGGITCCVEQGHYGHRARKATWLYACNVDSPPPALVWGPSTADARLDDGFHSSEERAAARAAGKKSHKRLSRLECRVTPPAFAESLLALARTVRR